MKKQLFSLLLLISFLPLCAKQISYAYEYDVLDNVFGQALNMVGQVDKVTSMDGMLALSGPKWMGSAAVTIGHVSVGPRGYVASWKDHLFVHEYGHYIQSQWLGATFIPVIGLNSLVGASLAKTMGFQHSSRWFETSATKLGARYFDENYGSGKKGYTKDSPDYFDMNAFRNNTATPYNNPRTGGFNTHLKSGKNPYPFKHEGHWLDLIPL